MGHALCPVRIRRMIVNLFTQIAHELAVLSTARANIASGFVEGQRRQWIGSSPSMLALRQRNSRDISLPIGGSWSMVFHCYVVDEVHPIRKKTEIVHLPERHYKRVRRSTSEEYSSTPT